MAADVFQFSLDNQDLILDEDPVIDEVSVASCRVASPVSHNTYKTVLYIALQPDEEVKEDSQCVDSEDSSDSGELITMSPMESVE